MWVIGDAIFATYLKQNLQYMWVTWDAIFATCLKQNDTPRYYVKFKVITKKVDVTIKCVCINI